VTEWKTGDRWLRARGRGDEGVGDRWASTGGPGGSRTCRASPRAWLST
jgi:hypothetical protein